MVDQLRVRRIDNPLAGANDPKAQINVSPGQFEVFVESAYLEEGLFSSYQAGSGDCQVIANPVGAPEGGGGRHCVGEPGKHMASEAIDPQDDSRMLNRTIGIDELRSHCADLRTLSMADKLLKPVRLANFDVIIQEQ